MSKAVAKVNLHSDAARASMFVCYFFCMVWLMRVGEIYQTEGKLVLGVYLRTKCIVPRTVVFFPAKSQKKRLEGCICVTSKPE